MEVIVNTDIPSIEDDPVCIVLPSENCENEEGSKALVASKFSFISTILQSMIDFDQSVSVQNDCQTLPRKTKIGNFDGSEYTKSWPRSKKKEDTKSILSSILKNSDNSKPSKSLYFSPMLNMFDSATLPTPGFTTNTG
jgi:hypothetical protein